MVQRKLGRGSAVPAATPDISECLFEHDRRGYEDDAFVTAVDGVTDAVFVAMSDDDGAGDIGDDLMALDLIHEHAAQGKDDLGRASAFRSRIWRAVRVAPNAKRLHQLAAGQARRGTDAHSGRPRKRVSTGTMR